MSDPLSPSTLINKSQSLCSPSTSLPSPSSVLLLVLHSLHSSLSFRLISPTPQDESNKLTQEWPAQGDSTKFKYKHDQSSLEFIISVVDLGDKLMVLGNAVNNPRSTSFEFLTTDYFSPSTTYPILVSSLSPSSNPFSTELRLKDLIHLYRLNILQKLIPNLRKDGYTELSPSEAPSNSSGGGRGLPPLGGTGDYLPDNGGPLGMYPRRPGPGGEGAGRVPQPRGDDPLRIPGSGGFGRGGRPIGEIGRNDLDPLGGMGGTFGGMGRLPGGVGGGVGGDGGGMFMGPDHPLFRERFEGGNGGSDLPQRDGRRWGGDGFLPPQGAPPGARFDPVGPENGPPGSSGGAFGLPQGTFGPDRGGGGIGRGGSGAGGLGRQVHPDIEQPGRGGSDYDAMFG